MASTGAPGQITVLESHGTRVAFLGFAPYPWASRLDRIPQALVALTMAPGGAALLNVPTPAWARLHA